MKLITLNDVKTLLKNIGIHEVFSQLIATLEEDFKRWEAFDKIPRLATHVEGGVIELMPTHDNQLYAFKYVNGHPKNIQDNKCCVIALGLLAEVANGYPILLSEMTLLTALRTAATSAMVAKYLAKKSSKILSLIGTGSQAEFQALAMDSVFGLSEVRFFDIDPQAMAKFKVNMQPYAFNLTECGSIEQAIQGADIITTATAAKTRATILDNNMIAEGVLINAIGGDCPGKTELGESLVSKHKVIVEFAPQSSIEGETQGLEGGSIHAEFWEILTGLKPGRENDQEIIIFDSVGFAIEDFSMLRYIYANMEKYQLGQAINMLPTLDDPKNLFSLLGGPSRPIKLDK